MFHLPADLEEEMFMLVEVCCRRARGLLKTVMLVGLEEATKVQLFVHPRWVFRSEIEDPPTFTLEEFSFSVCVSAVRYDFINTAEPKCGRGMFGLLEVYVMT